MMKKLSIGMLLVICLLSVSGGIALAAGDSDSGLVTCGKVDNGSTPAALDCGFVELMDMIQRLLRYLLMISIPIAAVSFAYAGWLYLSSGEKPAQISTAKTIFMDVGIGFILILVAWLAFKLIADTFLNPGAGYGTYFGI